MGNNPLSNKTMIVAFTRSVGKDSSLGDLSIQKISFDSQGKYSVTCVASKNPDVEKTPRTGKYTIQDQSDHTVVWNADEETGQFIGKYVVTFQWLDSKIGRVSSKKMSDGSSIEGIFQVVD